MTAIVRGEPVHHVLGGARQNKRMHVRSTWVVPGWCSTKKTTRPRLSAYSCGTLVNDFVFFIVDTVSGARVRRRHARLVPPTEMNPSSFNKSRQVYPQPENAPRRRFFVTALPVSVEQTLRSFYTCSTFLRCTCRAFAKTNRLLSDH